MPTDVPTQLPTVAPAVVPPALRPGFGLLELATAVALLVIVMGLTVSLARFVRAASAEQITRQVLRQLNDALARQARAANATTAATTAEVDAPDDTAAATLIDPPAADATEAAWADYVRQTAGIVRALARSAEPVTDAWGNPIGYLPSQRSQIGMAPYDRPFCFSAGPDGRYLTQVDNLYSYEQLSLAAPATAPAGGGHGE